jgi:branched-chain amino acid transport system permease protein
MSQYGLYAATLAFFVFSNCIAVWGLNLQFGLGGILNVGYIAFFAIGAYTTGVLVLGKPSIAGVHWILGEHLPFGVALLLGGLAAAAAGVLLGTAFLRRLRSDYLALTYVSFALVLLDVFNNDQGLAGGADGLQGVPQPFLSSLNLNANNFVYVFALFSAAVMIIMAVGVRHLARSPYARTLKAIRHDPDAAAALGKNVFAFQLSATGVGCFFAGISGGLTILFISSFNTSGWQITETISLFSALLIGGLANNLGAAVGVAVIQAIYQIPGFFPSFFGTSRLIGPAQGITVGVLLVGFLWLRPQGLIPAPKRSFDQLIDAVGDPVDDRGTARHPQVVP